MKRQQQRPLRANGFTLLELMVAVIVVGILAAIAIPSYTEHVRRGNRADAKSQLLQLQGWMQQQFTMNNAYPLNLLGAPASLQQSPAQGTAKYAITMSAGTAQTYTLQAAPTGSYADPKCGSLSITNNGLRAQTGTEGIDYCWNK